MSFSAKVSDIVGIQINGALIIRDAIFVFISELMGMIMISIEPQYLLY